MLQIFTSISDTLWSGYLKKKKKMKTVSTADWNDLAYAYKESEERE